MEEHDCLKSLVRRIILDYSEHLKQANKQKIHPCPWARSLASLSYVAFLPWIQISLIHNLENIKFSLE